MPSACQFLDELDHPELPLEIRTMNLDAFLSEDEVEETNADDDGVQSSSLQNPRTAPKPKRSPKRKARAGKSKSTTKPKRLRKA